MIAIGFRFSNTDYTYCVLSGSRAKPVVEEEKSVLFPAGYKEPEFLKWLHQEINGLLTRKFCDAVGIKKAEANVKRSNALEKRIQSGAIASLTAAQIGCSNVHRKVKSTIAKDLGLKGKAKYLDNKLDTSVINNFDGYSPKAQEAILVAWSCM